MNSSRMDVFYAVLNVEGGIIAATCGITVRRICDCDGGVQSVQLDIWSSDY